MVSQELVFVMGVSIIRCGFKPTWNEGFREALPVAFLVVHYPVANGGR
jgi:hypothetical protein